jgi:hypothetical protein
MPIPPRPNRAAQSRRCAPRAYPRAPAYRDQPRPRDIPAVSDRRTDCRRRHAPLRRSGTVLDGGVTPTRLPIRAASDRRRATPDARTSASTSASRWADTAMDSRLSFSARMHHSHSPLSSSTTSFSSSQSSGTSSASTHAPGRDISCTSRRDLPRATRRAGSDRHSHSCSGRLGNPALTGSWSIRARRRRGARTPRRHLQCGRCQLRGPSGRSGPRRARRGGRRTPPALAPTR